MGQASFDNICSIVLVAFAYEQRKNELANTFNREAQTRGRANYFAASFQVVSAFFKGLPLFADSKWLLKVFEFSCPITAMVIP